MDYVFSGLSENFKILLFYQVTEICGRYKQILSIFFKFFENYMRDKVVKKSCFV